MRRTLGILFMLGVIGFVAIPSFQSVVTRGARGAVDQVRRLVAPSFAIERAVSAATTQEQPEHGVQFLVDGRRATYWAAGDATPTATIRFDEPFDLGVVIIHTGAYSEFTDLRRPSKIEFVFPTGARAQVDLQDVHDPQQFSVDASNVTTLEVRVLDVKGPGDAPVAVSEIEFFSKR